MYEVEACGVMPTMMYDHADYVSSCVPKVCMISFAGHCLDDKNMCAPPPFPPWASFSFPAYRIRTAHEAAWTNRGGTARPHRNALPVLAGLELRTCGGRACACQQACHPCHPGSAVHSLQLSVFQEVQVLLRLRLAQGVAKLQTAALQ